MELESPSAPRILEENILFTFQSNEPVAYVGLRFAHEDYKTLHVFEYNQHQVFFLLYPVPEGIGRLQYRMVVDGVWMADPWNPVRETDILGIPYSVFTLSQVREEIRPSPVIKGREVTFYLKYPAGKAIYLAGDFNAYDPYLYRLQEIRSGNYEITLQLPPGEHGYYFVVDGQRYPDPRNPLQKFDAYKQNISILQIK